MSCYWVHCGITPVKPFFRYICNIFLSTYLGLLERIFFVFYVCKIWLFNRLRKTYAILLFFMYLDSMGPCFTRFGLLLVCNEVAFSIKFCDFLAMEFSVTLLLFLCKFASKLIFSKLMLFDLLSHASSIQWTTYRGKMCKKWF